MKPILQRLYRTRASAYQDAVRSFVQGYREGLKEQPKAAGQDVKSVAEESTEQAHQPHQPQGDKPQNAKGAVDNK